MLQRDNNTQRLYLHNVSIEKDTARISKADLLTTSAPENDHIFITTIIQNALAVKYGKKILYSGNTNALTGPKSKDDTIFDFADEQALRDMAVIVSQGFDNARETEREFGKANAATKYSIVTLDNGKQYVQADCQVLSGNNIKERRLPSSDGSSSKNGALKNGRKSSNSIIYTTEDISQEVKTAIQRYLNDEQYRLKGEAATHIDELVKVARFEKNREDIENKHENDIGEDGFNYYIAFFMDFDGEYYKISFSSAQNANKETVYSIGKVEKRKFPNRHGSSSKNGALKNGRKSSSPIIYTTEDKSQEVKTAIQLAFEKAFKKQSEESNIENSLTGPKSKDDTIRDTDYLSAVERGDMETAQRMVDEAAEKAKQNEQTVANKPSPNKNA